MLIRTTLIGLVVGIVGAIGILALTQAAPIEAQTTPASQTCSQAGLRLAAAYDPNSRLVASFDATANQVVRWQEAPTANAGPHPISPLRALAASTPMSVCYFEGTYSTFPRKGAAQPTGSLPPEPSPYERIVIIVRGADSAQFFAAGYRATLPITNPALQP